MYTYIHKWGDNDERILDTVGLHNFYPGRIVSRASLFEETLRENGRTVSMSFADQNKFDLVTREKNLNRLIKECLSQYSSQNPASKIIYEGKIGGPNRVELKKSFLVETKPDWYYNEMYGPIFASLVSDTLLHFAPDFKRFIFNFEYDKYPPQSTALSDAPVLSYNTKNWGEVHLRVQPCSIFHVDHPFDGVEIVETV